MIPTRAEHRYHHDAPFHYLVHLIVAGVVQQPSLSEHDLDDAVIIAKEKIRRIRLERRMRGDDRDLQEVPSALRGADGQASDQGAEGATDQKPPSKTGGDQ